MGRICVSSNCTTSRSLRAGLDQRHLENLDHDMSEAKYSLGWLSGVCRKQLGPHDFWQIFAARHAKLASLGGKGGQKGRSSFVPHSTATIIELYGVKDPAVEMAEHERNPRKRPRSLPASGSRSRSEPAEPFDALQFCRAHSATEAVDDSDARAMLTAQSPRFEK